MHDEATRPASSPAPGTGQRRFRRREFPLPGGGKLVLHVDGVISQLDAAGAMQHAWTSDDPEWERQAIRFGLRVQGSTVPPAGRSVAPTRPPRR